MRGAQAGAAGGSLAFESKTVPVEERRHFRIDTDSTGLPSIAVRSLSSPAPSRTRFDASRYLLPWSRWRQTLNGLAAIELARGTPFHFVPVLLGIGSVLYFSLTGEPGILPVLVLLLLLLIAVALAAQRPALRMAVMSSVLVVVGVLAAKIETARQETILLGDQISTRIVGRILSIDKSGKGLRAVVQIISTERPVLKYQPERMKVTLRKAPEGLAAGEGIKGLFLLRPPGGPVRPGSFDFAFDSYFDRIGATGVSISLIERAAIPDANIFSRIGFWFERHRTAIAQRVRGQVPGQSGEMSAALITGMTGGISPATNEAMRVSGLAHVTSISGLHMALVAGSVMGLVRLLLAAFPGFSSRHPTKKVAAILALFAAFGYYLLSGGGVATLRSFIMLAVMLTAVLFDRQALSMRNLVIAAIIIIVIWPHEIIGPSFQMSFAATAALIAGYQFYAQRRQPEYQPAGSERGLFRRLWRYFLLFVLGLAATSLIAGTATAIYSAYHFNRIAPAGLLANLAAMPAVSLVVMPMALLSTLLMPFGLEGLPLYLMGKGVDVMLWVAQYFAAISSSGATGAMPAASLVLLTIALLIFCLMVSRLRLLALPVAVIGLLLLAFRVTPDVIISEDGKLVAVQHENGQLLLNRPRPNRFTLENWQRAYQFPKTVPPGSAADKGEAFQCAEGRCQIASSSGFSVARIEDPGLLKAACDEYDIVIAAFPTPKTRCIEGAALLISARDLAKSGAAEIYRTDQTNSSGARFIVSHALSGIERPWHRHRAFSRAARNLEPYKPKAKRPPIQGVRSH